MSLRKFEDGVNIPRPVAGPGYNANNLNSTLPDAPFSNRTGKLDNKTINPTTAGNTMQKIIRSLVAIVALATSLSATSLYAGPFSALYVFGDSLSDNGNDLFITGGTIPKGGDLLTQGSHYYQGRFSNGPNYADQLASMLGVPLSASLMGGTDYAYGGARTNYVRPDLLPFGAKSFNDQILDYTTNNANADSQALYTLWIGANDMSDVLSRRNPAGSLNAAIDVAVTGVFDAIMDLSSIGAKNFLIPKPAGFRAGSRDYKC